MIWKKLATTVVGRINPASDSPFTVFTYGRINTDGKNAISVMRAARSGNAAR